MTHPTYHFDDVPKVGEVFQHFDLLLEAKADTFGGCPGCHFEHDMSGCANAPICEDVIFVLHEEATK